MNVLISGGTGFIGAPLSRELRGAGHNVIITTRRPPFKKGGDTPLTPLDRGEKVPKHRDAGGFLTWHPPALIPPDAISNIDAVINLAGEPIAPGRWTKRRKELLMSSRVNVTQALVESMKQKEEHTPLSPLVRGGGRVKVLISASAIGYYGAHGDEFVTEDAPPASDYLAEVCKAWEAAALKAQELGIRVVLIRIGAVLESAGGALPRIMMPFRFFLGGHMGSGRQGFSWIHRDDVVGIIKYALENASMSGPVNATAPHPVTNKEFCSALGKAINRPSWLHVPGFVLKLTLGELGSVLLTGQRVLPGKALKAGYKFKYTEINEALRAIFGENKV
ncbi:MAG: TIGR01777 family protein [Nitrospirae bacterium]|nr:TIGR01777 family protein [Nitrospirota bacterium]